MDNNFLVSTPIGCEKSTSVIGSHRLPQGTEPLVEEKELAVKETALQALGNYASNEAIKAEKGTAKTAIVGFANAIGVGAHCLGIGARLLQGTAAYSAYNSTIASFGYLGACRPVQYLAANAANKAAEKALAYTVCGISGGFVASAVFAVGTALTVAEVAALAHNTLIAKNKGEEISLSPFALVKGAFSMIKLAAAAA